MAAKSRTQHPVRFTIIRKQGQVSEILTNSSQLNHFLDLLKLSRARNTWINYGHDLKQFFDCIHKPPELIDRRDCLTFMKHQQQAGRSEATINRRLAAVSALFNELELLDPERFAQNPVHPHIGRSQHSPSLYRRQAKRLPDIVAIELRRAVSEGQMQRIELLYVHNCPESQNVNDELKVVAKDASAVLRSSGAGQITVSYRELGLESIEELFRSRDRDILIEEWMDVPGKGLMKQSGRGWTAIVTSVSGDWIRGLYEHNQDRLFSANFRDYLGAVERKGNINYGIKQTASSEPHNFWVYNNGVTAITNELQAKRGKIRIRGISIINGAQTSGALGDTLGTQVGKTSVLCRIVQCTDPALVDRIIRYNNTQNEIRPADVRSNDQVQTRIKQDFVRYGITYLHRRSAIRSPRNAISAATLAPWLCAFHGDHQTASRNAREIFNNDSVYNRVFPTNISVEHVFLVAALAAAIDNYKYGLRIRIAESMATELQVKQYEVLRYAMSKNFALLVVGLAAEEIMQMKVADLYEWKCKPDVIRPDAAAMVDVWDSALQALMPQIQ